MINPAVFRRGTLLTEIRFIPNQIINVLLKDYIRNLLKPSPQSSSFIKFSATFLSGYIVGAISMILTYPLDVISTRLTVDVSQPRRYQGTLDCISSVVLRWLIVLYYKFLIFSSGWHTRALFRAIADPCGPGNLSRCFLRHL